MRRRVASAVVVAAVAAVAVAAIVDAVRPRPEQPLDREAAAQLAELGVTGTLVYTDAACGLRAVSLPDLTPAELPGGIDVACEISVSPDGRHVAGGGARWSPDGRQYAICRGTRVDVVDAEGGPARGTFTGCAPAWRPDGMLTLARDRTIRESRLDRVLVAERELERVMRQAPFAPRGVPIEGLTVRDQVWLSPEEVVALLEAPRLQAAIVAGFVRGRLAWQKPYFGRFERLVVSGGRNILLEPAGASQIALFATGLTPAGPVAWSPDGEWLGVATRASVLIVSAATNRRVRIPVSARDVAWR